MTLTSIQGHTWVTGEGAAAYHRLLEEIADELSSTRYRRDADNIMRFVTALGDAVWTEALVADLMHLITDLYVVALEIDPRRWSLARLLAFARGYDPFKEWRLSVDEFARKHRLDWERGVQ